MDAEQILAFRLARLGLASRDARGLAEAAACPASDFSHDAALLALAARVDALTRQEYDAAVDHGDLVRAPIVRGAIHVLAPSDLALYGRALIAKEDGELGAQLGQQFRRLTAEAGITATDALAEVTAATSEALSGGRALSKDELHDELRPRVRAELKPWCKRCRSHHVAPMLWRYGAVKAGARMDSQRRYVLVRLGQTPPAAAAVKRFLHFYGPATAGDFADWAGIARSHASRIWQRIEGEVTETVVGRGKGCFLRDDVPVLESPPEATGIRLVPPGDPYLANPNRALVAPNADLRKRLFRPVASPGAILKDGALAGLWRVTAKGGITEITVERLGRLARSELEPEVQRVADLRGAPRTSLVLC